MYSSARRIPQDLGLSPGQWFERGNRLFKNTSWYDPSGQNVGGGDIAKGQPEKVATSLESGEMIAIVPSYLTGQSYSPTLWERFQGRDEDSPGQRFVSRSFVMLIVPRCIYLPGQDGNYATLAGTEDEYPSVSSKSALDIIQSIEKSGEL